MALEFETQPTKTFADSLFRPTVKVIVRDQNGDVYTTGVTVALALDSASIAAGATIEGATTSTASGVATFEALRVKGVRSGVRLRAGISGTSATPALSASFDVLAVPVPTDSTALRLLSDSAERATGIYRFQRASGAAVPRPGSVLVGAERGGYLIKVKSVEVGASTVTLQADPAALEDVVRDGELSTSTVGLLSSTPMSRPGSTPVRWGPGRFTAASSGGFSYSDGRLTLDDYVLYGTSSNGVVLSGAFEFDPDFALNVKWSGFTVQSMSATLSGEATMDAKLRLGLLQSVSRVDSVVLGKFEKSFLAQVGLLPVYGRVEVKFSLTGALNADAEVDITTAATSTARISASAAYASKSWSLTTNASGGFSFLPPSPVVAGGASATVGFKTEVRVFLYEVIGPYVWAKPWVKVGANVDIVRNSWESECRTAVELGVGIQAKIFGYSLGDFARSGDFLPGGPYPDCTQTGSFFPSALLSVVSGNDQQGTPGLPLPQQLVVRLTRAGGMPATNVPVSWAITGGGGTLNSATSRTDQAGVARVSLTLGPQAGTTTVEARAAGASGSPRVFRATGVFPSTISGLVLDDVTRQPIEDASISIDCAGTSFGTVRSSANGRFTSPYLPAGLCGGSVGKIDYEAYDLPVTSIQVGRDVDLGVIALKRILRAQLKGTVRHATSAASIPGATVELWAGNNNTVPPLASALTDAAGQYQFTGLAEGTYTVSARAPGFSSGAPATRAITAAGSNTQDLMLVPLVATGSLNGTVRNTTTNAAIAGATVQLWTGNNNTNGAPYATTTTNASGTYALAALPAGPYTMRASAAGYQTGSPVNKTVVTNTGNVQDFALSPQQITGSLGGTVRNATTNAAIAGATVQLWSGSNNTGGPPYATATTSVGGTFAFAALPQGPYTLRASAANYQTGSLVNKSVVGNATNVQDLTLTPQSSGGTITLNDFSLIPAGTFAMGSTNGLSHERPVHNVTITRPFYLQRTEVTQAQWQAVMGSNPSFFTACGPACPVERVSWVDVQQFITKLNQMNPGVTYRLPTEAEWEYAARAGTTGDYGGNGILNDMGWWSGNSGGRTQPVARKLPNAAGLHDMHGNVWEWVQDWYSASYYSASPAQDPPGPATGSSRVLRGGSWNHSASNLRSAFRTLDSPSLRNNHVGFRLARTQ